MDETITLRIESVDLAVVGAGPAGLAAAAEVARLGGQVTVVDEAPNPGGRLLSQIHEEPQTADVVGPRWFNGPRKAAELADEARGTGVKILCGNSVWGIFRNRYIGLAATVPGQEGADFPAGLQSRALLIAAGAAQNPLLLPGWTLPGVMTVGAAQTLINVHQVAPGKRVVVVGSDPLALSVAQIMTQVGINVRAVVLPPANGVQFGATTPAAAIAALSRFARYAPTLGLALAGQLGGRLGRVAAALFPRDGVEVWGFPLMLRRAAVAIGGSDGVDHVRTALVSGDGTIDPSSEEKWYVDAVITSAGLFPLTELLQLAGCPIVYIADLGGYVPLHNLNFETPVPGVFVAGSATGVEGAAVAEAQGRVAGVSIAHYLGLIDDANYRRNLSFHQETMTTIRQYSFPFLPNIVRGRQEMARLWGQHNGRSG